MKSCRILLTAAVFAAGSVFGAFVESGELDLTQKNAFWDCTGHSCLVSRESASASVTFAAGSVSPSAAASPIDAWICTVFESEACPLNSFPTGFLLFFR